LIKTSDSQRIIEILWGKGLAQVKEVPPEEPFIYTNGTYGPGYVRVKGIPGYETDFREVMDIVEKRFLELGLRTHIDAVCGIYTGAVPFSRELSARVSVPFFGFKKNKESPGEQGRLVFEAYVPKGSRVLLFEDIVNNATNTSKALERLLADGFLVPDTFAIGNYGKPEAERKIASYGSRLTHFFLLEELLDYGIRTGKASRKAAADYMNYALDSEGWNKRYAETKGRRPNL
jgi:orotate phosphoribosyltransferase